MEEDARDESGRFRKGSSGNPNGRPTKQSKFHSLPPTNRRSIFEVVEQQVSVRTSAGEEKKTIYEAILTKLAVEAAKGDRQAMKMVLAEVHRAASENERTLSLVGMLQDQIQQLQDQLAAWERRYPSQNGGVLVMLAKGQSE
jgi:hypothetical protein